eukprot:INCI19018.1.p1 GENE.INCI19018.1~~INCI19018.1.p1  ORF type:complete len:899 (-),score=132.49 INCI19018.1:451-2967(-)
MQVLLAIIGAIVAAATTRAAGAEPFRYVVHSEESAHSPQACVALAAAADSGGLSEGLFTHVRTLRGVLDALEQRWLSSCGDSQCSDKIRADVYLCPGLHTLDKPLVLGERHSHVSFHGLHGSNCDDGGEATCFGSTPGPAVLSGALAVRTFSQQAGSGIWTASIPTGSFDPAANFSVPQQLFAALNGNPAEAQRRTRARHPNLPLDNDDASPWLHWAQQLCPAKRVPPGQPSPPCNNWARFGFVWNETDDAVFAPLVENASVPIADWQGDTTLESDVQAVVYHGWTASRHHVKLAVQSNRSLLFKNPSKSFIGFFGLDNTGEGGRRYYLTNHRAFLDFPGEWFLDVQEGNATNSTLSYLPADANEINALQSGTFAVFLPRHTTLLTLAGAHNVSFSGPGLQISFSNWECGLSDTCDQQSTEWLEASGIRTINSTGVAFSRTELSHHGGFPLWIDRGSVDIIVDSCNVTDTSAGGVRIGHSTRADVPSDPDAQLAAAVQRPVVFNTSITDGSHDFPSGTALFSQMRVVNLTLEHCEIARYSYTGISLGWSWNYAVNDNTGGARVTQNHVHHLGYPRRETGDAMACVYTLNGVNGAVFDGNVCHDVRAYMNGGYCLSQDQGSSNATFSNNLCLRVTGSPHNTHYGVGLRYENNVFALGNWDNHYPALDLLDSAPVALRTSPQDSNCESAQWPGKCPNLLNFSRNVFLQGSNTSTVLFEGDFSVSEEAVHNYTFTANAYSSDVHDLTAAFPAFGGKSARMCHGCDLHNTSQTEKVSFSVWQANGQDTQGVAVGKGETVFADPNWASSFNLTLNPDSPVAKNQAHGFVPFDASNAGLLPPKD